MHMTTTVLTLLLLTQTGEGPATASPKLTAGEVVNRVLEQKRSRVRATTPELLSTLRDGVATSSGSVAVGEATGQWQQPFTVVRIAQHGKASLMLFRTDTRWVWSSLEKRPVVILEMNHGGMFYLIPVNHSSDAVGILATLIRRGLDFRGVEREPHARGLLLPYGVVSEVGPAFYFGRRGFSLRGDDSPVQISESNLVDAVILEHFVWVFSADGESVGAAGYCRRPL